MTEPPLPPPFRPPVYNPNVTYMCLICRKGLTHFADQGPTGAGYYDHQRPEMEDHAVLPVVVGIVPMAPRCDFCNLMLPDGWWHFTAASFDYADGQGRSMGDWCACSPCKHLVVERAWMKLADRVATSPDHVCDPRWNPAGMRSLMLARYRQLGDYLIGAPYWETEVEPYPADRDLSTPSTRQFQPQSQRQHDTPDTPLSPYGNYNNPR